MINAVAGTVGGDGTARVTIVGRTDASGSPAFNMQLSQKRAAAVHDALIATGKIKPDQLDTAWTGERKQSAAGGPSSRRAIAWWISIFISMFPRPRL